MKKTNAWVAALLAGALVAGCSNAAPTVDTQEARQTEFNNYAQWVLDAVQKESQTGQAILTKRQEHLDEQELRDIQLGEFYNGLVRDAKQESRRLSPELAAVNDKFVELIDRKGDLLALSLHAMEVAQNDPQKLDELLGAPSAEYQKVGQQWQKGIAAYQAKFKLKSPEPK